MSYENKSWLRLGNVDFPIHYLVTVTEEEAVGLLTTQHIHEDRVRNAWKQANKLKSPNRKKEESVKTVIFEPKKKGKKK